MPLKRLEQRTPRELLIDSALTLALYHIATVVTKSNNIGDRLKAVKLVFFAAYPLYRSKVKAFSFSFQKYTHGPFTREIWETWGELQWAGLITIPAGPAGSIELCDEGHELAKEFISELRESDENLPCIRALVDTALTHAGKSTRQILNDCYDMSIVPYGEQTEITVRDTREGMLLTKRLTRSTLKSGLAVSEDWLKLYDIRWKLLSITDDMEEDLVKLHTPELISEIEQALSDWDKGEGNPMTREELLQELYIG